MFVCFLPPRSPLLFSPASWFFSRISTDSLKMNFSRVSSIDTEDYAHQTMTSSAFGISPNHFLYTHTTLSKKQNKSLWFLFSLLLLLSIQLFHTSLFALYKACVLITLSSYISRTSDTIMFLFYASTFRSSPSASVQKPNDITPYFSIRKLVSVDLAQTHMVVSYIGSHIFLQRTFIYIK